MAGIGFELRKLLKKESLAGLLQAYAYAGIISSGPWVLSILGMLVIGLMSLGIVLPAFAVTQFQVSITWIIASSLVLTGLLQLAFTRYIADRLYEKQFDLVAPSLNGAIFVVTTFAGTFGLVVILLTFDDASLLYRLLLLASFVVMSNIWMTTIMLSSLKQYVEILQLFALGYGIAVGASLILRPLGMEGLLIGFLMGHVVILVGMWLLVVRSYPGRNFIDLDFLRRGRMYWELIAVGFMFNLGIWADKLLFWLYPATSQPVIGPLRASLIYDLPAFLAQLAVIPGMAVFLTRMETDFAEYYERFYEGVRGGASLEYIESMRNEMAYVIRQGIAEIIKIQAIAMLVLFAIGPKLLGWLGISELYVPLLYIDLVAASLQVVLLGILNVFFYLDKRRIVLVLSGLLVGCNFLFTALTLEAGAAYFGYGFAASLLVTVLVGFWLLDAKLESLEYETFMLQ